MARNIYALLVGIDSYPPPVSPLQGCINDVLAVEEYLRGRVHCEGFQLNLLVLKNQEATRQAIIDGFRQHLAQAGSEDVALFYYSGHGSQAVSPPEFWHLEPDRLNETMVCWDSRTDGGWDLADKEITKLIAEIAVKNPHITLILDCCHSGSGTRNPLMETCVRRIPIDKRQRPLNSFIVSLDEAAALSPPTRSPDSLPSGWTFPKGRHILLAACRDNEEAKECFNAGQSRGTFCFFLLETLKQANRTLTYRDLFKRANALVRTKVIAQSPQLEATNLEDLDQPFLGGAISQRASYFTVSHDKDYGWVVDAGAVHGMVPGIEDETTRLALFPFDSPSDRLQQLSSAIGTAEVTEVLPQLSQVTISGVENLLTDTTFKAVVTGLPMPPLGAHLEGDPAGIRYLRQAWLAKEANQMPSLYVREVFEREPVEFRVLAQNEEYIITRLQDERPLVAQIQGYSLENAIQLVQRLEHIARWMKVAELASPATSRIPSDAIRLEIYQDDTVFSEAQVRLEYKLAANGKWTEPTFQVKLTNTYSEPLYCALLDLTDRYAINPGLLSNGGVWLNPGEEAWANDKNPLYGIVPKKLWEERGVTEVRDIFKLIVSTAEFDATLLAQDNLDLPRTRALDADRGTRRKSTLNRLMRRVQVRDVGNRPEEEELYDDWVTSQITLTTVRPLTATSIPNQGYGVSLGVGVTLQPHPELRAQARLTTITQSTRDLGHWILPPILREDPQVTQAFQFTPSRGTDPGLTALELKNVDAQTITTVTPQQPLTLLVDTPLGEDEHILPIAYDGEFFLPLGFGQAKNGRTEIVLERLPDPVSEGNRSLTGSIRIFFQKVIAEKLGLEFPYPVLAVVEIQPDGTIRPEGDTEKVKQRVATANRIAVYIHGIIGDTRSMVATVQQKIEMNGQLYCVADFYDLVLTFDYENINTSIEANARSLKQRLEAVGLGATHGKTLHLIAHSMGGLVSRWFIEREGGNQMVQHLLMLGTPNAGSPWPTVQAWAIPALAFGLNSLSTVAWPVKVLGSLLTAIETIDVTLDQMQPGSDFLKSLAASPDPGVPYTILAGNTSIIQPPTEEAVNRLKALIQKLTKGVVEFPFFGQPNDIAVTVHSIQSLPTGRALPPQVQEVACDHLVYFMHSAGLTALVNALLALRSQPSSPTVAMPSASVIALSSPVIAQPTQQDQLPSTTESQSKPKQPQWLKGFLVGIGVAALAIAGFWLWQRSQSSKPNNSSKADQSFVQLN